MATQTTNFKLTKPAYTETADIAVINSNMDTIDTVLANEAEQYDATDAYYVGDYCIYNGVTYRCTVDIETPEAFNSSHWTVIKITDEIADANLKKEQLDEGLAYVAKKVGNDWRLPSGKTANAGDYVIWDGSLGKAKSQIVGGSTNITSSNWEIVSNGALNAINALNSKIENIGLSETGKATIFMNELSFTQKGSMYVASVSLPDATHNIPAGVKIAQVCKYGGGIGTIPFVQTDNDGSNLNVLAIDNPGSNPNHYINVRWYK